MKITIISPPLGEKGEKSDSLQMAPPILEYLASLIYSIDPEIELELMDANREDCVPSKMTGDLFMISSLTPQSPWAYRLSDGLRDLGKSVILGGMHVTVLPEEAKPHANSIVTGECESIMVNILDDFKAGALKPHYEGERVELDNIPARKRGLLKSKYMFDSFYTAKGCPYLCTYCSVMKYFGKTMRFRPIDDVISEIASSPSRMFMNIDDNIWGLNIVRSIEMFKAMSEQLKGKYWFGQGDMITVQQKRGEELLNWAQRSGLTTVMVGWETNDVNSLDIYKADTKQGKDRIDGLKMIRDNGVDVMMFIMVGSREESLDEYMRTLEVCDKLDVSAHPVMLSPFPGTDIYDEYKDFLIPGKIWDDFDGNQALFTHDDPMMTPFNREQATLWLRRELFTWPRILKRLAKIGKKGFPMAHMNSIMLQWAHRRSFNEYAEEHLKDFDLREVLKNKTTSSSREVA